MSNSSKFPFVHIGNNVALDRLIQEVAFKSHFKWTLKPGDTYKSSGIDSYKNDYSLVFDLDHNALLYGARHYLKNDLSGDYAEMSVPEALAFLDKYKPTKPALVASFSYSKKKRRVINFKIEDGKHLTGYDLNSKGVRNFDLAKLDTHIAFNTEQIPA